MTPVEKLPTKISATHIIQALTLSILSTLLISMCFSVLPVGSVEIIYKQLQIDSLTKCKTTNSQKLSFKYYQFCPNLIFRSKLDDEFIENPIQNNPFVQIVKGKDEQFLNQNKYNQQELISEQTACRFFDKNIKLLAARTTSLPWNFTGTRQCRHVSNKFPENQNVPCEIRGESSISLSLRVDPEGLTALFNENSSSYCRTAANFLIAIFRKRKGGACMVKVQQYKIDLNMTKEKCEDYETFPTCGLYACSEEKTVLKVLLEEFTGHATKRPSISTSTDEFSNSSHSVKPYSDYQFQKKPKYIETYRKKETITDYFLELVVLLFLALLFVICLFTKCCRYSETTEARNQPITMVSESRRASDAGQNKTYNDYAYSKHTNFPDYSLSVSSKGKCSAKPSCVCSNIGGRKKTKTKKWGHRGCDDEAYTPVRQDDTAPYIPSVARV